MIGENMSDIVGIRFKSCGKIYDFEAVDLEVKRGDAVVVESELGVSIGSVVVERRLVAELRKDLKKVLRKVTEEDLRQKTENESLREDARKYCLERIMARGLPMKLTDTEVTLDRKRIIFYFTAENRIDFRELVKDLAAKFKTRIEMRQIGVRDEAKMLGGLGICGRELCCRTFLTSFEPISIRMAKRQDLSLNANKLSGVCGRLMCCLNFEYSDAEDSAQSSDTTKLYEEEDTDALIDIIEEPVLTVDESRSEPAGVAIKKSEEAATQELQKETLIEKAGDTGSSSPKPDAGSPPVQAAGTVGDGQGHAKKGRRRRRRHRRGFHG